MTGHELRTIAEFEEKLEVGQEVVVKWTAGSFGHYKASGKVARVNAKSVRVAISQAIQGEYGGYPEGHEIVVPLITAASRWTHFNRVEPVEGYLVRSLLAEGYELTSDGLVDPDGNRVP
jgi:hypothetical protein